jgi:hypothetical protein
MSDMSELLRIAGELADNPDATDEARHRLGSYQPSRDGKYWCPACWINRGVYWALNAVKDGLRCPACKTVFPVRATGP